MGIPKATEAPARVALASRLARAQTRGHGVTWRLQVGVGAGSHGNSPPGGGDGEVSSISQTPWLPSCAAPVNHGQEGSSRTFLSVCPQPLQPRQYLAWLLPRLQPPLPSRPQSPPQWHRDNSCFPLSTGCSGPPFTDLFCQAPCGCLGMWRGAKGGLGLAGRNSRWRWFV